MLGRGLSTREVRALMDHWLAQCPASDFQDQTAHLGSITQTLTSVDDVRELLIQLYLADRKV